MNQPAPIIQQAIAQWHTFFQTQEQNIFTELVADEVVFRSPFLWKPKAGKEILWIVLSTAAKVFEDFKYHRELTDATSVVLEFSAHIGEVQLKGIDLIRFNDEGKIIEFEVMVRPIKGLQALGEAMAKQMMASGDYETFSAA